MSAPTPEELLARFCANTLDPREYLLAPFVIGDFVYATNGHIAIRVPRTSAPDITATTDKVPGHLEAMFATHASTERLDEIPELPAPIACSTCNGTGRRHECPDCDGEGEIRYGRHDYECAECRGDGQVSDGEGDATVPCNWCSGSGEAPAQPVKIGSQSYQRRYLALIQSLPGARFTPPDDAMKPLAMGYFIFEGGEGVLMPMKP